MRAAAAHEVTATTLGLQRAYLRLRGVYHRTRCCPSLATRLRAALEEPSLSLWTGDPDGTISPRQDVGRADSSRFCPGSTRHGETRGVDPIAEYARLFRTIVRLLGRLGWQWRLASLAVGLLVGAVAFRFATGGRRRVARAVLAGSLASYVALVFSVTVLGRPWRAPRPVNAELLSTWAARLSNASMRYEL